MNERVSAACHAEKAGNAGFCVFFASFLRDFCAGFASLLRHFCAWFAPVLRGSASCSLACPDETAAGFVCSAVFRFLAKSFWAKSCREIAKSAERAAYSSSSSTPYRSTKGVTLVTEMKNFGTFFVIGPASYAKTVDPAGGRCIINPDIAEAAPKSFGEPHRKERSEITSQVLPELNRDPPPHWKCYGGDKPPVT